MVCLDRDFVLIAYGVNQQRTVESGAEDALDT